MPIPYSVKRLVKGRLRLQSHLFSLLHHPDEVVESFFMRFKGVKKVKLNKGSASLSLDYDPDTFDLIEFIGYLERSSKEMFLEDLSKEKRKPQKQEGSVKPWLIATSLGFIPYALRSLLPSPLLVSMTLLLSLPVLKKGMNSIKERRLDVHVLDSSALLLTSFTGSPLSAHLMSWLLQFGDYMEERIERKARASLEKLMDHEESYAWLVVEESKAVRVRSSELKVGDLIVVYSGEKITADGVVEDGTALVNQASLTGESNPVLKQKGDKVYSGTFVEDGKLYIKVSAVGEDTVVAGIVRIIEESIKEPLSLQRKAEEFANTFVKPTLALGLGSYLFTGQVSRLTSTLIVDYHTGVHLTTPLAVLSAVSELAKRGVLVKSGSKLELLSRVNTIVMDKTGTLTIGSPKVMDVVGLSLSEDEVFLYGASLEQRITHPIARAIVKLAQESNMELLPREDSKYHIGMGIEGYLHGEKFMLGSTRFMQQKRIKIPQEVRALVDGFHAQGKTVLYLVKGREVVGLITVMDPLREEAKDVVKELQRMGIEVILCTGDNEGVTSYIANSLGIKRYHSRMLPADKAQVIKKLKSEGKVVAFVGDGVNDSPALSVADVGISLRGATDIAIEVADVVIGDSLWHLVETVEMSRKIVKKLRGIYRMNGLLNTVGLVGSVLGLFGPPVATAINNGTTVALGLYSLKSL